MTSDIGYLLKNSSLFNCSISYATYKSTDKLNVRIEQKPNKETKIATVGYVMLGHTTFEKMTFIQVTHLYFV